MTETTLSEGPPLAVLLDAMGHELRSLGAMVDRVQEALSPALSRHILDHPGALGSLQDLDRLAQTVRALGGVADRLSSSVVRGEPVEPVAILTAVSLADLAARLGAGWRLGDPAGTTDASEEDWDDGFTIPSASAA